jgi:hypothetical protein
MLLFGLLLTALTLNADVVITVTDAQSPGLQVVNGPSGTVLDTNYDLLFVIAEPETTPQTVSDVVHILGTAMSTSFEINYTDLEGQNVPCLDPQVGFFGCQITETGAVQFLANIGWLGNGTVVYDTVDFVGNIDNADIPEPSALLLLVPVLALIGMRRKKLGKVAS